MIQRIVSGAQTGVDRAALDAALELGIDCGGWAPLGRLDECGRIPDRYPNLVETDQANPAKRTALNVRDSDATLILSRGPLTGGSLLTERKARGLGRPCLHVDLAATDANDAVREIRAWLASVAPA